MSPDERDAIGAAVGSAVASTRALSGGDINEAYALELSDGRRLFAKTNRSADPEMFPAEARGLAWLREAGALRVPEVVAVSDGGRPAFLVLELIEPTRPTRDFDEQLGRGLARLHRFGAERFGLDHDNFIGRLPQHNAPLNDWAAFYGERRIEPQVAAARDRGTLDAATARAARTLIQRLPELVGPAEPPARLHGDLWGGNLHVDEAGQPCLIDPAAYAGHREVDLAMMRLFGGFGPRTFSAYGEAYPLAEGADDRVNLYQLYPLLVHVNLFGGGYVGGVRRAIARYV